MDTIARGLVLIIAAFLVVSMIVFALINLPAGDPAQTILGNQPWVEEARALNRGLDTGRPLAIRYFIWLGRVVQRLIQGSGPKGEDEHPLHLEACLNNRDPATGALV